MVEVKEIVARAAIPVTVAGILGVGAFIWTTASTTVSRYFEPPYAQRVKWDSGAQPGMEYWDEKGIGGGVTFVPWADLNPQLRANLLPSLFKFSSSYRFAAQAFGDKENLVIKILDQDAKGVAWLWLGGNPENGWEFDGLVRVGGDHRAEKVWQVYQRFSDGSYRRLKSTFANVEDACPPADRPCTRGN